MLAGAILFAPTAFSGTSAQGASEWDGDARAGCAIADLEHNVVEFWRVPYDVEAVQKRMLGVGLPEPLALRLAIGR